MTQPVHEPLSDLEHAVLLSAALIHVRLESGPLDSATSSLVDTLPKLSKRTVATAFQSLERRGLAHAARQRLNLAGLVLAFELLDIELTFLEAPMLEDKAARV